MNDYLIGLALAYAIVVIFNFIAISILSDNWKQEIRYCINPLFIWYCFWGLVIAFFELNFKVKFSVSKDDPEKAVLPTVIFYNLKHKYFTNTKVKGFSITIGWWHYGITFFVCKKHQNFNSTYKSEQWA